MFRLLIAIQLLQFCQADYITDSYWRRNIIGYHHIPVMLNMWYLLQTEISNKGVAALFVHSPTYHAVVSEEVDNIAPKTVKSNSAVVTEEPNPMVHLADFQVSSIEGTPEAVPVSIIITSSDTIVGSPKDKHYSNEIFKRRVAKMAVAPSYESEVSNPSPSTAGYESQAVEQVPSETEEYGRRIK